MLYILLIIFLFILLILMWCFKYLLLIFLGFIFFLLFVLSLKGYERIIVNFIERKNINNKYILKNKVSSILYYLFILIIVPTFILCISSRLFIIINNIYLFFLKENIEKNFLSLYLSVIIFILFISTVLIWIDVFNKKDKNGKYKIYTIIVALFITFSLILSIFIRITGMNISYLYILEIICQLNILSEVLSILISGDLILLKIWEKEFNYFNLKKINIKFSELKNYLNLPLIKNYFIKTEKLSYFNNSNKIENNIFNFKYNKALIKGRNGNIITRIIQFILDTLLFIINKLYNSHIFTSIKLKYINTIRWGYILTTIPPVRINEIDIKNNNEENLKISSPQDLLDNQSINKKRKISSFISGEEKFRIKKKVIPTFLNDHYIRCIDEKIYYPGTEVLWNVKDISKNVLNNMDLSNKIKEDNKIINIMSNNIIKTDFEEFMKLPYHMQIEIEKNKILELMNDYMNTYNNSMQSKNMIINYIDFLQVQELTHITTNLLALPEIYERKERGSVLFKYNEIKCHHFNTNIKCFSPILIKVPLELKWDSHLILFYLRKHFYILDYDMNCRSMTVQTSEDSIFSKNDYYLLNEVIINHTNNIKNYIINRIKLNEEISDHMKELQIKYYTKYFGIYHAIWKNKYQFSYDILINRKFKDPNKRYLDKNIFIWKNIHKYNLRSIEYDIKAYKLIERNNKESK